MLQYGLISPLATTLYCDPASPNAKIVFEAMQMQFATTPQKASILWMRRGYTQALQTLARHQTINHLPNERALIDKSNLARGLQSLPESLAGADLPLADFFPQTFCLETQADLQQFRAAANAAPSGTPWIVKPADLSKGRGIKIFDQPKAVTAWLGQYQARQQQDPRASQFIAQRYLTQPLLLNQRKSEIRIYFLVLTLSPLRVLLCKAGTVRLNTLPFELGRWDNPLIHITNVYQQKKHPNYDPDAVLKWGFSDLEDHLCAARQAEPGFIAQHLRPRLKAILRHTLRATQSALSKPPSQGLCFALFGADLILDAALNPWLTEVQKGPGLSLNDPVKRALLPAMLAEAIALADEARFKTLNQQSMATLQSRCNFEWVINDDPAAEVSNIA